MIKIKGGKVIRKRERERECGEEGNGRKNVGIRIRETRRW